MPVSTLNKSMTAITSIVKRNLEHTNLSKEKRREILGGIRIFHQYGLDCLSSSSIDDMKYVLAISTKVSTAMLEVGNIILDDAKRYKKIGKNEYNRFMETVN